MNEFYDALSTQERASVRDIALKYSRTLYPSYDRLLSLKSASSSPYYVGLSSDLASFTHVTKRVVLATDTVLLSNHGIGTVHDLGTHEQGGIVFGDGIDLAPMTAYELRERRYGVVTEDLAGLGQWLLEAEPLLRNGLVWYGPVYQEGTDGGNLGGFTFHTTEPGPLPSFRDRSIDFVVEHGRAVDLSRDKPLASRVVRPVLEMDLPFIDGLSLSDFAKVTAEEFDSYRQYRDFMRSRLLELDDALEAVDSQVALERVSLAIRDELNSAHAAMSKAARTSALARSGAVLGTTSAVLAAVRPEALQGALAVGATLAAGATGLWPTIQAFADIKPRRAHGKWHYIWVLLNKTSR
ncbi:hypothetical protein ACIQKB_35915 [Streptomyces sp. NPDC092046]|uniref:hypothetical protein n=1 Tax=Streptomyces sp. NPDC092046 TaxID=3366009 RepID=UPI003813E10A